LFLTGNSLSDLQINEGTMCSRRYYDMNEGAESRNFVGVCASESEKVFHTADTPL
jgi:hypothetical protein